MTNDEYRVLMGSEPWLVKDSEAVVREGSGEYVYDLEERTARFGEAIIDFLKKAPLGPRTDRLVGQLTGCGTSVGANYCESDDAVSLKEFAKNIGTCRKEAREAKFFIRMIVRACPELALEARPLWREANELHLIFSKIRRTIQSKQSS